MKPLRAISLALLCLLLAVPSAAQKLVNCSVSIDGRAPFPVESIYPDQKE